MVPKAGFSTLLCRRQVGFKIKGISVCFQDTNASSDSKFYPFSIGDVVYVGNHTDRVGTIAFIGSTEFAQGEWIGKSFRNIFTNFTTSAWLSVVFVTCVSHL